MSKIFISYRRSDSIAEAGRIYDTLELRFGRDMVFKDVDDIDAGDDFRESINQAVGQCQVLLAVIGKDWVQAKDAVGRRRLDNPADWVRLEIETALKRGIRVIPLLLDRVGMPTADKLPEGLKPLAYRNAAPVRHDPDFRRDMDRVIRVIQKHFDGLKPPTFEFEVATVNTQGQVAKRQAREAEYVSEALGNGVSLDLVKISGGTFQMGSPKNESERIDTEGPQHSVTVSDFWMGKFPVTQAQWRAVASFTKVKHDLEPDPSNFKGDYRSVEQISWHDEIEFCARLSQKTGREYLLPSEAEWEYACRAGTTTPFHFGATVTTDLANYRGTDLIYEGTTYSGSYGDGPKGVYREETAPVGSFKAANAFGLCDMHGNVWEWCLDHWHENYQGAPTDGSAWLTGGDDSFRLLRGGSWYYLPENCRSANRSRCHPVDRNDDVGLRVACRSARAS